MRRRRTIYFNDARHYYLFVFEPPMTLEDAWVPVDEAAGTAVDTFAYGVERGDGLFYPSKVGMRFGEDIQPFESSAYWRVWHNMQSLMDRGLDPLTVLIDRAHDKGMEFIASMRLGGYGKMDPALKVGDGGRGYLNEEVRDHVFAVLKELATDYATDGVELDFAAAPGGSPYYFRPEDADEGKPVMTEWVRKVSGMVRGRAGGAGVVGARVYPTEAMNLAAGLDVRTWLSEGLLDYVTPMIYAFMLIDTDMPIDWLVEAAHAADTSVYPLIHPFSQDAERAYATPAMMRAAAANYWHRGADGMYAWFLHWPLGDAERRILTDLGDSELAKEGDKHYVLTRKSENSEQVGYKTPLPVEIASSDTGTRHAIPFFIADDVQGASDRIRQIKLKLNIGNMVSDDRISILLNGQSLSKETCLRDYGGPIAPYVGQWLEFHLESVRPKQGENLLEVSLDRRAEGLVGSLSVDEVEIIVEYGPYPSGL
jgi:hypothetical protein